MVKAQSQDPNGAFPLDGINLDTVTNETLEDLLGTAPFFHGLGGTRAVRLSKDLVLKGGGSILPCEAEVLNFLASKPGICAPRVHRSFQIDDDTQYFGTRGYIVMDFNDGRALDKCWSGLPPDSQTRIAMQIAEMINEMRSINVSCPGPFEREQFPWRCRFFTDYSAGPFKNVSEMEDWFNHKLEICQHFGRAPKDMLRFQSNIFVLTHQDISPRNIILTRDGQPWLIDWAHAGAYPPVFKSAGLLAQHHFKFFSERVLSLITRFPKEEDKLDSIMYYMV